MEKEQYEEMMKILSKIKHNTDNCCVEQSNYSIEEKVETILEKLKSIEKQLADR